MSLINEAASVSIKQDDFFFKFVQKQAYAPQAVLMSLLGIHLIGMSIYQYICQNRYESDNYNYHSDSSLAIMLILRGWHNRRQC